MTGENDQKKKARLLAIISCCVGAVVMGRALGDSALAENMMTEVKSILEKEAK